VEGLDRAVQVVRDPEPQVSGVQHLGQVVPHRRVSGMADGRDRRGDPEGLVRGVQVCRCARAVEPDGQDARQIGEPYAEVLVVGGGRVHDVLEQLDDGADRALMGGVQVALVDQGDDDRGRAVGDEGQ
jgi:hypothetical protein